MVYELLTGEVPYRSSSFRGFTVGGRRVGIREAVALGSTLQVPQFGGNEMWKNDVATLMKGCWAYNPRDRPSANELVNDLKALLKK